jgi:acetoin utilization protein AcuB
MSTDVVRIGPQAAPARAIDLADASGVEHLVVTRGDELVGVLCTCDLWDVAGAQIGSVMARSPIVIPADATIARAAELATLTGVGCLPVMWDGRVVGIVTRGDLARAGALDLTGRICASCGSHHHVRPRPGAASLFCARCVEGVRSDVAYEEIGWGD